MKRKFLLALCLIYSVTLVQAQAVLDTLIPRVADFRLKGSVQSISSKTYKPIQVFSELYSPQKTIDVDKDYQLFQTLSWDANDRGCLLSKTATDYNLKKNKIQSETTDSFLYKDGLLLYHYKLENAQLSNYTQYRYKKNGLLLQAQSFNRQQRVLSTVMFSYKNNTLSNYKKYDDKRNLEYTLKYKWAAKDNYVIDYFDKDNKALYTEKNTQYKGIDSTTVWNYAKYLPNNNLLQGRTSVRDAQGNIIEDNIIDANKVVTTAYVYTYDLMGNVTSAKSFGVVSQGNYVTYNYEYIFDEQKNWTRRVTLIDNVIQEVTDRTLTYRASE